MVKRILSVYAMSFLVVLFISSCATTHPNEKLIVGKWKPVHAEAYKEPGTPEDNRMERLIDTEMRSPVVINSEKTFEKSYPNKTVSGTWKMIKKGTRVIATIEQPSKKFKMEILSINDSTFTGVEYFDLGNVKIKYVKENK